MRNKKSHFFCFVLYNKKYIGNMLNLQKYSNLKYLECINIDFDPKTDNIIISLAFSGKKQVYKQFTKDCLINQHDEIDEFITDEINKYLHLREKKLKRILK